MPKKISKETDLEIVISSEEEKSMTRADRLRLHFETDEYIDDEDLKYYLQLEQIFNFAFGYERKAQVIRMICTKYRVTERHAFRLIDDCQVVFGQFFEVKKKAKRYLQELKLNRHYEMAFAEKDNELCLEIIKEVNKLYSLYDDSMDYIDNTGRQLPKIERLSNPELLKQPPEDEQ